MRDKGLEEVENFNLAYNENNKNNHKKGAKKMHEYSAGSIVYRIKNNKIEFLLVQSRLNRTWGFPKGHLEKDENNVQAAQREVYEEVGLKPDYDFNFEESITYKIARDRLKTVTLFLSKFNPDQKIKLQKSEIGDYKWATLAEANSCLNYEELKELLKKAQEYIENEISR